MRNQYPIEQLLRPPVEVYAAVAYFICAALVLLSPSSLMLPGAMGYTVIGSFLYLGYGRWVSALRLKRYQYQLCQLPLNRMLAKDIPKSTKYLFIGIGFEWRVYHSARRADLLRNEWRHIMERDQDKNYLLARKAENILPLLRHITGVQHYLNPVAPIERVEGNTEVHGVGMWEGEKHQHIAQIERAGHTFVVGTTRVGKTRLAEAIITQDIHDQSNAVIVMDPKGDAELLERMYKEAERAGRLHQFYVFHLGFPEMSARYNPLDSFARITEVPTRIATQLPGEGQSATFKEFTWRYVNVITKAATALGLPVSYEAILNYGSDIDNLVADYLEYIFERENITDWRSRLQAIITSDAKQGRNGEGRDRRAWAAVQLYNANKIADVVAQSLVKTFEYDKTFYDKLVASLFPFLEKVTSGESGKLLSPDYFDIDDPRPIFDWASILRQGGIVYVGLDALADAEVATAVGSAMFSDLTSTASMIYKHGLNSSLPGNLDNGRIKVRLHLDEFNELVGSDFVPMANKAGGAGFEMTAYTQSISDVVVRFGDDAKAEQVIANLGTIIMLRVKGEKTAKILTEQMRDVEIKYLDIQSLVTDSSDPTSPTDFVSRTGDVTARERVPLIHVEDIVGLPKGHAFALIGGKPYKIRLPWIMDDDGDVPKSLKAMTDPMRVRYRTCKLHEDAKWAANDDMAVAA